MTTRPAHTRHWHGRGPNAVSVAGPVDPDGCCATWRLLQQLRDERTDNASARLDALLKGQRP